MPKKRSTTAQATIRNQRRTIRKLQQSEESARRDRLRWEDRARSAELALEVSRRENARLLIHLKDCSCRSPNP